MVTHPTRLPVQVHVLGLYCTAAPRPTGEQATAFPGMAAAQEGDMWTGAVATLLRPATDGPWCPRMGETEARGLGARSGF